MKSLLLAGALIYHESRFATKGAAELVHKHQEQEIPYENLTPDVILDAIEGTGVEVSGTFLALNSYENRVYRIGLNDGGHLVAKFYRPGRWEDEAILEEHRFTLELAALDIPVIAPQTDAQGQTLLRYHDYRFALFPCQGGRWPELDNEDNLRWLGRFIARIHAVGANQPFAHRPRLDLDSFGLQSYQYLMEQGFVPAELQHNYRLAAEQALQQVEAAFAAIQPVRYIRLHGDCHPGNILWTDHGPHFVDLDDCRMGPAVQDLWMLLSGTREEMTRQLCVILEGYGEFFALDPLELHLIEPLRTLRMLHYSAWLARRWSDPAFPMHFPWFNTPRYWEEQLLTLREQNERMDEPPLELS